jgi:Ice-binding-like
MIKTTPLFLLFSFTSACADSSESDSADDENDSSSATATADDADDDDDDADDDSSMADTGSTNTQAVDLGLAGDFAVLAKSGISNVPPSTITGDLGVSPAAASYITGLSLTADASDTFSTSAQVTGNVYASDYVPPTPAMLTTAVLDMELAFSDAAGRAADVTELGAGDIGGMTLDAGTYRWGTGLLIPADLTLDGTATDVWIFQVAENLTVSNGSSLTLTGGARPEHVFWQVSGKVELGTTSRWQGVVLSETSATLGTGASITGRLLAQTEVTLDGNTIVEPAP